MVVNNSLQKVCSIQISQCYQLFMRLWNPLFHNFAKWLNILLKSCAKYRKMFKVCLTILQNYEIKSFRDRSIKIWKWAGFYMITASVMNILLNVFFLSSVQIKKILWDGKIAVDVLAWERLRLYKSIHDRIWVFRIV